MTGAARTPAFRAKVATSATEKVATPKVAGVRTATGKAATAKAAPAAKTAKTAADAAATPAARKPTVSKAPAAKPVITPVAAEATGVKASAGTTTAAKPTAAKATAAKPAAPEVAAAETATAKVTGPKHAAPKRAGTATGPRHAAAKGAGTTTVLNATAGTAPVRPTPHRRRAPAVDVVAPAAEPIEAVTDAAPEAPAVIAAVTPDGRLPRFLRRRPPSIGHRPALFLAAALVGAIGISAVSMSEPSAQATDTMGHSVSVAQELGIEAAPSQAITDTDAAELLGELAVSRNARVAEQAAAVQVQAEADRVAAEAAAQAAAEAARPKAVLPVAGARLTSGFGARWGKLHAGIDLAAPMQTPEYAVMDGVVLEAGPASGFGLAVYIQHANGDVSVYGHMDSILVQAGQVVRAGDTIALLGNRGQSTGPHLHFEVHVGGINGEKIDPLPWLRANGIAI
jgi:murein DD-endopeptidase MepM/ murein hydrolase activator NlpD